MSIELPTSPTITVDQAAEILGISRSLAHTMAQAGELPTIRLGVRTLRVPTQTFLAKFGLTPATQASMHEGESA